jgi:DNA-binding response OmpR family regulator
MRILIIDDDLQLLRALTRLLRRSFIVTIAPTLVDASIFLATETFDVILCDLRMPLMDAERFVTTLAPGVAALVVYMSGAEAPKNTALLHPRLLKPFTVAELMHAIACRCPAAA